MATARSRASLLVLAALCCSAGAATADCSVSIGAMNFGSYDVFSPVPLDSVASITYSCSAVVNPTLTLSSGNSGSFSPRSMQQGTFALAYNLYLDAARTTVWGDGTSGTSTYTCSLGTNLTVNMFGRIFAGQNLPVGPYADNILATIIF